MMMFWKWIISIIVYFIPYHSYLIIHLLGNYRIWKIDKYIFASNYIHGLFKMLYLGFQSFDSMPLKSNNYTSAFSQYYQ